MCQFIESELQFMFMISGIVPLTKYGSEFNYPPSIPYPPAPTPPRETWIGMHIIPLIKYDSEGNLTPLPHIFFKHLGHDGVKLFQVFSLTNSHSHLQWKRQTLSIADLYLNPWTLPYKDTTHSWVNIINEEVSARHIQGERIRLSC